MRRYGVVVRCAGLVAGCGGRMRRCGAVSSWMYHGGNVRSAVRFRLRCPWTRCSARYGVAWWRGAEVVCGGRGGWGVSSSRGHARNVERGFVRVRFSLWRRRTIDGTGLAGGRAGVRGGVWVSSWRAHHDVRNGVGSVLFPVVEDAHRPRDGFGARALVAGIGGRGLGFGWVR